jgi:hypothetical protein
MAANQHIGVALKEGSPHTFNMHRKRGTKDDRNGINRDSGSGAPGCVATMEP